MARMPMAKYAASTKFIVNGVDMSSYVRGVEVSLVAGNIDTHTVTLVGALLTTSTDGDGRNVITISIGEA